MSSNTFHRAIAMVVLGAAAGATSSAAQNSTERLYQQACDAGDMIACNVFGLMYEAGEDVPANAARAASLYERACEGGEPVGCTNVGILSEAGRGVERDLARAAGFYRVACEAGEQLGCSLLTALEDAASSAPSTRYDKTGRIGDVETRAALANALIEIPDLDMVAVSDSDGRFDLKEVPPGRYALRAECLGYDTVEGVVEVPGKPRFFVLLTPQQDAADPTEPGHIVGRVTEGSDEGLGVVEISVLGQDRARTLSDRQGHFALPDVEPGLVEVRFARLGYAPRTAMLVVQPGRTAEVAATMAVEPIELAPIDVTVRSLDLERTGFYERADRGFGTYVTPQDLKTLQPLVVSDALLRIPGVQVVRDPVGDEAHLLSRRGVGAAQGGCTMPVYIDGVRMLEPDVNLFPVDAIAAVEVYQGAGTPVEYGADACGVVLLWTRSN